MTDLRWHMLRLEEARMTHQGLDEELSFQDKLRSNVQVALHAMFEKLRPVKVPDVSDNLQIFASI